MNINQELVNSLQRLLNGEIGGLHCRVITTEYRTRHCPLYTHVTHILQCVGPYYLFGRVWSMFVYNISYFLQNSILSLYFLITTHIAIAIGDSLTTWFYTFIGYGLMEGGVYQNVHVGGVYRLAPPLAPPPALSPRGCCLFCVLASNGPSSSLRTTETNHYKLTLQMKDKHWLTSAKYVLTLENR